jgi:acetyl-CoA acyltransferase 1
MAGIPDTVPQYAINRLCSSGLQAVMNVANQIRAGEIDCGIGGGIENMTMFPMQRMIDTTKVSSEAKAHEQANICMMPMGITSENVAEKYGITRA